MRLENFIQSQVISLIDKARSAKQEMFIVPMIAWSAMIQTASKLLPLIRNHKFRTIVEILTSHQKIRMFKRIYEG